MWLKNNNCTLRNLFVHVRIIKIFKTKIKIEGFKNFAPKVQIK